jgi:hypothetical protein
MSHAVPAGSREVTVAFNFISELTVIETAVYQQANFPLESYRYSKLGR